MTSIKAILQQRYAKIQTEWRRYRNNPYDVERPHDLRVAIRTLRGLIKFLKRDMPQLTYESLDNDLSQAAKLFSPLRDLDVLIAEAGDFAYEHPEESSAYSALFEKLRQKRDEEMKHTLTKASRLTFTTCLKRIKTQLDSLTFESAGNPDYPKLLAKEFKRRDRELMKQYHQLDFHDYPRVHHVRKRAKTLRYSATYFADFVPKKERKRVERAKRIQDICGVITDAHVNDQQLQRLAANTSSLEHRRVLLQIAEEQRKIYTADKQAVVKRALTNN